MPYNKRLTGLFVLLIFSLAAAPLLAFDPNEVIKIQADYLEFQQETQSVIGRGHIVVTQGQNWLKGENIVYYLKEKKIVIQGKGSFSNGKQTIVGEEIIYNSSTGEGSASEVVTEQAPWLFQAQKLEQLKPKTFYASPKTSITTCNQKPIPHYHIEAREVLIYQDERIVARGVTIYFGQVPVFHLPSYTYALKHRNYFLRVGYDEKYGMWGKSGYNYDFNKNNYGALYLDWWERRGLAKGIRHNFRLGKTGVGSLYYYCIKESQVLYDPDLSAYYNPPFPKETNRTKFASRYLMDIYSPLNKLKVNIDLATDPAIEYQLTEQSLSLIYNRTTSVTLERTTKNYNLEIYGEKIDNYNSLDKKYYLYTAQLPKISFTTNRLPLFEMGKSRFYQQYQFHFTNKRSWAERSTFPLKEKKDYFEQAADASFALSNTLPLTSKNTLSSSVTLKEDWFDHRSIRDLEDIYITKTLTEVNWRSKLGQFFTNDLAHKTTRRYTEVKDTIYEKYQGVESALLVETLTINEPWWRSKLTSKIDYDLKIKEGEKKIYWREKLGDLITEIRTSPAIKWGEKKTPLLKQFDLYSKIVFDPYASKTDNYHRHSYLRDSFLLKELEFNTKVRFNPYIYVEYKQRRHFLLQNYADWSTMDKSLNTNYANFKNQITFPFTENWKLDTQFEYRNRNIRKRYALEDFRLFKEQYSLTRDLHCWEVVFFYSSFPELDSPRRNHRIGFDFHLKAFPSATNISTDFPPKMFWFE